MKKIAGLSLVAIICLVLFYIYYNPMPVFDLRRFGLEETQSFDISHDGKNVFILDRNNTVFQFSLNEPWNFNSITFHNARYKININDAVIVSLKIGKDGRQMYVTVPGVSSGDKNIYRNGSIAQYFLAKPFELMSVHGDPEIIPCDCSWPMGVTFDETGNYMQVVGAVATEFFNYKLKTPYNIKNAINLFPTFISRDIWGLGHVALSRSVNNIYYTIEEKTISAYQFKLDGSGDYPELRYDYKYLNLSGLGGSPRAIILSSNGKLAFVLTEDAKIYTFNLKKPFELDSRINKEESFIELFSISF